MVPKRSGYYPPSEYKEKFIAFPVQERLNPMAHNSRESPITLSFGKNAKDWQSQYRTDFQAYNDENSDGNTSASLALPMAGCPPAEDVGRLAPSFFAWEPSNPQPPMPPPREEGTNSPFE